MKDKDLIKNMKFDTTQFAAIRHVINNLYTVMSTDGVGSKLKLASMYPHKHNIGQDLVAMCVNDIICHGATPKYFLDYIATDKLGYLHKDILMQIEATCFTIKVELVGGETAVMPTVYPSGETDLAGFCVGFVYEEDIISLNDVTKGDYIIGLTSSGIHANGFTYLDFGHKDAAELLEPTKLYVNTVLPIIQYLNGIAHITGGGIRENLARILPEYVSADIDLNFWKIPNVFRRIYAGEITVRRKAFSINELLNTYNCGIGMILIVAPNNLDRVFNHLASMHEGYQVIGMVTERQNVRVNFQGNIQFLK